MSRRWIWAVSIMLIFAMGTAPVRAEVSDSGQLVIYALGATLLVSLFYMGWKFDKMYDEKPAHTAMIHPPDDPVDWFAVIDEPAGLEDTLIDYESAWNAELGVRVRF